MPIDAMDARILNELQADGRIRTSDLADRVGLSATPCHRRIRLLEEAGVIRQYVTLLDQDAVGYPVSVYTAVALHEKSESVLENFEREISLCPEVMECYLMSGAHDYMLRVVAADLSGYERFIMTRLTRIPGVRDIQSSFALRRIVYKTALPVREEQMRSALGSAPRERP